MEIDWSIVMENKLSFFVKLHFNSPELVSQFDEAQDSVSLSVLRPDAFVSEDGKSVEVSASNKVSLISAIIEPKQEVDLNYITQVAGLLGYFLRFFIVGNFAMGYI